MRYPILTRDDSAGLADQRLSGPADSYEAMLEQKTAWVGDGADINVRRIEDAAQAVQREIPANRRPSKLDQVEGRAAPHLYAALEGVPVEVLDDRGFWRYLSLAHFWDFIAWREQGPFDNGNHMRYVDGENSSEAVLPRMYLRVAVLGGAQYAELASSVEQGTDFWRSHILRVRTGTAPALTRALVRMQKQDRLKTDDIRDLAKRLTRTWTNAVLNTYDDEEAEALIAELRSDVLGKSGPGA